MYYLYVPYVLILSGFVLSDSSKQKMPRWWAVVMLLAPVAAPFYFFKTRSLKGVIPVAILLVIFIPVCLGEYHLYVRGKAKSDFSKYSSAAKQMIELSSTLKQYTDRLFDDIDELEKMSKAESRLEVMGDTISFIGEIKVNLVKARAVEQRLSMLGHDYNSSLGKEGLIWISDVINFYDNPIVVRHMEALSTYLDAFEASLQYVFSNYKEIEARSFRHLRNYDAYYLKYRRSVDRHNILYKKRIQFQNYFLKNHPRLKPYLPSVR